jgi:hypothetical protein
MTPSVSPEAEWELTEGALFYAREGGAELGLAFISEFERIVALLCANHRLGPAWRGRRRVPLCRTSGSTLQRSGFPVRLGCRRHLHLPKHPIW